MEQFLSSIEKSIETENWVTAIFASLSIPDICGGAENKIKGNGARYRDWFNRYMRSRYAPDNLYESVLAFCPHSLEHVPQEAIDVLKSQPVSVTFTAEDCWALRNACLHEGRDEEKLKKFKITIPDLGNHIVHLNRDDGITQLDAKVLCEDIVNAARKWLDDIKGDAEISGRVLTMMHVKERNMIF